MMKSEFTEPTLQLSLFQERTVKRQDGKKSATKVITFVPIKIAYNNNTLTVIKEMINSVVVESVIAYIEEIAGSKTIQALESHLNDRGTSFAKLCQEPDKIEAAIHRIFGEGAQVVIDATIMVAYRTLGLKCCENVQRGHTHDSLAQSLLGLRRLVLEAGS